VRRRGADAEGACFSVVKAVVVGAEGELYGFSGARPGYEQVEVEVVGAHAGPRPQRGGAG